MYGVHTKYSRGFSVHVLYLSFQRFVGLSYVQEKPIADDVFSYNLKSPVKMNVLLDSLKKNSYTFNHRTYSSSLSTISYLSSSNSFKFTLDMGWYTVFFFFACKQSF